VGEGAGVNTITTSVGVRVRSRASNVPRRAKVYMPRKTPAAMATRATNARTVANHRGPGLSDVLMLISRYGMQDRWRGQIGLAGIMRFQTIYLLNAQAH